MTVGRFWVNGRFAWPFVIAVVIATALAMIFDFGWRVLVMSFETYLIASASIVLTVAIAFAVAWLLYRRRASRQPGRQAP